MTSTIAEAILSAVANAGSPQSYPASSYTIRFTRSGRVPAIAVISFPPMDHPARCALAMPKRSINPRRSSVSVAVS